MKTDKLYKAVTIVSMVTMPAAAAINFGDAAFDALNGRTNLYLAIIGGLFTGIGFETIGIVAGHRAVSFYSKQDRRWVAAGLALLAYIVIGVFEMLDIPFARFVPILSGLVYILAGLQSEAESENHADDEQAAWEREQLEKDKALERELKRQAQADKTAVKLAQVKVETVTSMRQEVRHDNGNLPADWRQLTRQQKHKIAHATREKREEMMPELADRTRREWHKRADEIAAQNGHFVV